MDSEMAYLVRRADEEWTAAEAATHPRAREAHVTMARLYEERMFECCRKSAAITEESENGSRAEPVWTGSFRRTETG